MNAAQDDKPDRSRLKHIVVMLLSMALLCEHAASRRHSVRLFFFRLLSHAETVALGLFDGPTAGVDVAPDEPRHVTSEDLIALAVRLRSIAILVARAFLSGGEAGTAGGAGLRPVEPALRALAQAIPAAPFHDTS